MAGETNISPILNTKLHRPPVDENHVHRPHLLEQLDKHRGRPLTLVSAPAGYGKSSIISSWLETNEYPGAWLSLSKSDGDIRTFISYFIAAIREHFPNICPNTHNLLKNIELPPLRELGSTLLNELDQIKQPFILVLDDYYLIKEIAIHNLITQILKHPPQFFQLVIVGRHDPPLPIYSLRARSQLTEIRTEDLRFSAEETEELLNRLLGIQIDKSIIAALGKKTEGWVTGLRLAAISMRQGGNINPKLLEPHADAHFVMEYLFNEVFSQQPDDISRYLLSTAVLDRFCGPLCEAVCLSGADSNPCKINGWEFIKWMKRENIFVTPLDPEKRWFRYHHLFQRLLVNQLNRRFSPEEIKALHVQAGAWLAENGLIEEALRHYMTAEEIPSAMQLLAQRGHNLMNNQQWPDLKRLIDMLPSDHVDQDPELLIFKTWHNHVQTSGCDLLSKVSFNKKIEPLINNLSEKALGRETQITGHFEAMRAIEYYLCADGENALRYSKSACNKIPKHHRRARVSAYLFLAASYQMLGELEKGISIYTNEIQESVDQQSNHYALYIEKLCYLYWMNGDLGSIQQTADRSLRIARELRMPESVAFALYYLGIVSYHQNKLRKAEELLTQLVNNYYFLNVVMSTHGTVALAMVYMDRGEYGQAEKYYKRSLNYASEINNQEAIRILQAFGAEFSLRRGRIAKTSQWAERFIRKPIIPPYLFYFPHLTLAKILMAKDTLDSKQQAADLLNELNGFLLSIHNKQFHINVLALQALVHDMLGKKSSALDKLTKALTLAEPSGYIRLFVDLGPKMFGLLNQLVKKNVASGYIGQILAAFRDAIQIIEPEATDQPTSTPLQTHRPSPLSPSTLEPLTNREIDVLELLELRLSNKEIAAKLFISPKTVKKHLENIYGKLEVNKRRQAVEKAIVLKILPSH